MNGAPDPARTQMLQQVSAILSALLDMAHGTLPADDFAISIVVRYRHLDTGHMLVGDDGEDQIIGALEAIKRQSGFIGTSTADPAEVIIGAAKPGAARTCPRCVEPVQDITITRCPQCGADMPEVKRDVVIRDEPPELLLEHPVADTMPDDLSAHIEAGGEVEVHICNRKPLDPAELVDVSLGSGIIRPKHGGSIQCEAAGMPQFMVFVWRDLALAIPLTDREGRLISEGGSAPGQTWELGPGTMVRPS